MKNKKGFTLIELIAVLVIMAIIALIVTPLVMSIIRKARAAADRRSVDAYGRSIEIALAGYLLDNGEFTNDLSKLEIEYSGSKVTCTTAEIKDDYSVYLTGCKVDGRDVTDADGSYVYKNSALKGTTTNSQQSGTENTNTQDPTTQP